MLADIFTDFRRKFAAASPLPAKLAPPFAQDLGCRALCKRCNGSGLIYDNRSGEREHCFECWGGGITIELDASRPHAWRLIDGEPETGIAYEDCARCGYERERPLTAADLDALRLVEENLGEILPETPHHDTPVELTEAQLERMREMESV